MFPRWNFREQKYFLNLKKKLLAYVQFIAHKMMLPIPSGGQGPGITQLYLLRLSI